MHQREFTLKRGAHQRGSRVGITFGEDVEIGGMVLRIVADGYWASARSPRRDGASQWSIACSLRPGRRERRPVRAAA